ncbi:sugar transferase [bacterium]|nr:sugar transferase [bacterium]
MTTLTFVAFLADLVLAGFAFVAAYYLKISLPAPLSSLDPLSEYGWLFLMYVVLFVFTNYLNGFYTFGRTLTSGEIVGYTFRSNGIALIAVMVVFFVFKVQTVSRLFVVLFAAVNVALAMLSKLAIRRITGNLQRRGYNVINALLIGSGEQAEEFLQNLLRHPELGYRVIGAVDVDRARIGHKVQGVPVIGHIDQLHDILVREQIDEVFCAVPAPQIGDLPNLIWVCEEIGIRFSIVADFIRTSIAKSSVRYVLDVPLLTFSTTPSAVWQLFIKSMIDRMAAGMALLLLSPLFAAIAIAIKLTTGGAVFFTQKRCGLNGRVFTMFKFRTMVENAEQLQEELRRYNEMDGPVFKMKRDPRVTVVGRFLRRFSLDELPQLYNVLRGEMSLVGPRPPIPEEVTRYERWQRRRLSMRPGLTCFWQISGRNEIDFQEWMRLDLKYIDNWSLKLDFQIIGKTIPVVITGRGAS